MRLSQQRGLTLHKYSGRQTKPFYIYSYHHHIFMLWMSNKVERNKNHHQTLESNQPGGNTGSSPPAGPSCWGRGWQRSFGTRDMWWWSWTELYSPPYDSNREQKNGEKAKITQNKHKINTRWESINNTRPLSSALFTRLCDMFPNGT